MELSTALERQILKKGVHDIGINENYWYAVGWTEELQPGQILPVVIWQRAIAVFRDALGTLHALEDACPHKGVALSRGKVQGQALACRYHGWEFDGNGQCVNIPYLRPGQKLPCAQARSFPVQERYNLIWVFPGEPTLADRTPLPEIPEFDQSGWFMVPSTGYFKAHFSFCNENSVDMFHGFLHHHQQGWFDPVLTRLEETESSVLAEFLVSYKGRLAKFLGLSAKANEVTTLPITIEYRYPHYACKLQQVSCNYMMRLPVSPTESRSFVFFFFRLRLPQWLLKPLSPLLRAILRQFLILRFLEQDVEMVESEQRWYRQNPQWRTVEINPAVIAVQRLMVRQYERFRQTQAESSVKQYQ